MEIGPRFKPEFTPTVVFSITPAWKTMKQCCSGRGTNGIDRNRTLHCVFLLKNTRYLQVKRGCAGVFDFNAQKPTFDPGYESITGHEKRKA
jgi:hypothetical protein